MFQRAQFKQNSLRHFLYSTVMVGLGIKKMRPPPPLHMITESFAPSVERQISCAGRNMNHPAERGCFSGGGWVVSVPVLIVHTGTQ
jgi:hypothetical protein